MIRYPVQMDLTGYNGLLLALPIILIARVGYRSSHPL